MRFNLSEKASHRLLAALRIVLGGIFAYSGFLKLLESPVVFSVALDSHQVVPSALLGAFAAVAPWVEFIFGAYLMLGFSVKYTVVVLGVLALIYEIMVGQSIVRQLAMRRWGLMGGELAGLRMNQGFFFITMVLIGLIQFAGQNDGRTTGITSKSSLKNNA